ncbi:MAG: DMT family transporter [Roseibium sp.]|uniref:DMT family transporter n=1 Tax=Roseibium sp. TaxID=1936156 RepID=UPI001B1642AB|nr:DMT family transporter [Roseibium sp.]MBO6894354.1 DMT family transporter [Roseibium sp.]MBO6932368.1 DMT family transporter [Roseibium sp.]
MNSTTSRFTQIPLLAALAMIGAGASFALVNGALQASTMQLGVPSTTAAFWQYALGLLVALPWVLRRGVSALRTQQLGWHLLRAALAVIGIQLWVAGLARVEIWQAIALVMTSPFFVIIGAKIFLKERVGLVRWLATVAGFSGGMVILEPWTEAFNWAAILPVGAAAFWAGTSLVTKKLTATEQADSITVYLLLLLTPVNALLALGDGGIVPSSSALWFLVGAGVLTVVANYLLTLAYQKADAAFVQPFDHLKLPLNIAVGFLAFGFAPTGAFWPGALVIVGASLLVMLDEQKRASLQKQVAN